MRKGQTALAALMNLSIIATAKYRPAILQELYLADTMSVNKEIYDTVVQISIPISIV
jgi:hypothetical protein